MKKPSARRQKLREKALAEYLTVPPEERAKRNREFVRKMREETQAWDDFQKLHLDGVMAHYAHAREKYPYFCDGILSPVEDYKGALANQRSRLATTRSCGMVAACDLVDCELLEAYVEAANGKNYAAVEELYDAIAVLLRAIDVLEGRQKLGKPEAKGEAK